MFVKLYFVCLEYLLINTQEKTLLKKKIQPIIMICVFTAMTGPSVDKTRDTLLPVDKFRDNNNIRYMCFTNIDGYTPPNGWIPIRIVEHQTLRDEFKLLNLPDEQYHRFLARYIKLQPHKNIPKYKTFTYTLWMDGNVELRESPQNLVMHCVNSEINTTSQKHTKSLFSAFLHPERNTMAQELSAVRMMRSDEILYTHKLEDYCRAEKFKDTSGLYETCVIIRTTDRPINILNNKWWNTMTLSGLRDQIALPVNIQLCASIVRFVPLRYRWRDNVNANIHIRDWPVAPWVKRKKHNNMSNKVYC